MKRVLVAAAALILAAGLAASCSSNPNCGAAGEPCCGVNCNGGLTCSEASGGTCSLLCTGEGCGSSPDSGADATPMEAGDSGAPDALPSTDAGADAGPDASADSGESAIDAGDASEADSALDGSPDGS